MTILTPDRRSLLKGGATLLAAAATMSSEQLLGYAKAWAQTAQWNAFADVVRKQAKGHGSQERAHPYFFTNE